MTFLNYEDMVNVEQLSEMLGGVSAKTVYRLLKKGEIQSKYVGKRYLIPWSDAFSNHSIAKNLLTGVPLPFR